MSKKEELTELERKQIDVNLKEYEILRNEMPKKEQRIQTIISLYVVAILGVAAYILKEDFVKILGNIDKSNFLIGIVLFIPIVNSILLIYSISFMYVINAQAKYTTYVIGKDISNILKKEMLGWDKWDSKEKRAWLRARNICGVLVFIFLNLMSIGILYYYHLILLLKKSYVLFSIWIIACIVFIYCIYNGFEFLKISKKYHEM